MDYAATSERLVAAAWMIGAASATTALAVVLVLFALRLSVRAERRAARAVHWRHRLLEAIAGDAEVGVGVGGVPLRERVVFLDVWCRLHGVLRGDARQRLNDVLVATGLDDVCRWWIHVPRPIDRRQLGVVALGHLATRADWARLRSLLDAPQTWLATAALQGLLRIDPGPAAALVLDRLRARADWPRDVVLAAFDEAGPDAMTSPLLAWLATAPPDALPRGLPFVACGHASAMQSALLPRLHADLPVDALAAVIRHVDLPHARPRLRELAAHPAWEIRTQVANALGRLGDAEDEAVLRTLLQDREWWVRLRAAQALVSLPAPRGRTLPALLREIEDPRARDTLRHAAAERGIALPEPAP